MARHENCTSENGISQKYHFKTFIIGFLKYHQHPANKTYPYN